VEDSPERTMLTRYISTAPLPDIYPTPRPASRATKYLREHYESKNLEKYNCRYRIGDGRVDGTQPLVGDQTLVVKVAYETRQNLTGLERQSRSLSRQQSTRNRAGFRIASRLGTRRLPRSTFNAAP
jgi:hypothetical protein